MHGGRGYESRHSFGLAKHFVLAGSFGRAQQILDVCHVRLRASGPLLAHEAVSPHWIKSKSKNPNAPAVRREAEEDWGR